MLSSLAIVTLSGFYVALLRWAPAQWFYSQRFQESEQLVRAIDSFQTTYNRVPNERELSAYLIKKGISPLTETCPCYRPVTAASYEVWFGYQSTGTSMVYQSTTQDWERQP